MITALYAALLALLMIWLAVQVIKLRHKNKVSHADGEIEDLQVARGAQGNAAEYIPITLILMTLIEYNGANALLIHGLGVLFVLGRVIHARAILSKNFSGRVKGMKLTFAVMFTLVILNFVYLPFDKLW
ncbi:MAPEG family protein [Vibrio kasasachensis]|uniref:MAPEG family protein n=1 Tax=Vibrio kasasachensis TaxID=2910248 RepID=UPI003D13C450